MCSIIGVGERLHKVLGQIDLGTLDSGERYLFFFGLSESKCRTVLLESVASTTDHDQHVIHAMSLHMII